ncbi:hypothetical protein V490_02626 [Pseudogymnoascus sp. VKM F-3557]|nr:hypothetical protein V490_02626 [Pseudogymnoascus sp. VKM F-3557]
MNVQYRVLRSPERHTPHRLGLATELHINTVLAETQLSSPQLLHRTVNYFLQVPTTIPTMSDINSSTTQAQGGELHGDEASKGKGKAADPTQDVSMGEEDEEEDSSDDEIDEAAPVVDEADDDNMEEIDTSNIISGGRRTRGRQIDFAQAAKDLPEDEEDEDDDGDFEAPADEDKMDE